MRSSSHFDQFFARKDEKFWVGVKSDFLGDEKVELLSRENCILGTLVPEFSINSIPDGWKKCSLGIEMRGFLLYGNEISWNL